MSSRVRWTLIVIAIVAVIIAGAVAYPLAQPAPPPLPSEDVEAKSGTPAVLPGRTIDPAGLGPSAQNELECVDRLLQGGAPADSDPKAEWERCAALGEAARARSMPDNPELELDRPVARNEARGRP